MRRKPQNQTVTLKASSSEGNAPSVEVKASSSGRTIQARRSGFVWFMLLLLLIYSTWSVYVYQFQSLPAPLSAAQAGKRGFSEHEAMRHIKALTDLGPHPVGSDSLDRALQYVLTAAENIKETAHWEVDVEVDFFQAESGANYIGSGLFLGKTVVYSDINHVILRILPKYVPEAGENAILVSSHIDTVFSAVGAGDCSSCVAVILELARSLSQSAHGFKNGVIFLLNTGEEEGLNGAHSFMTQHPWSSTVRAAVDLEAMGIGGKSSIFQTGPDPWAIELFASVAKYPSGQIIAQDLFHSGAIKSATDFQIYREVANLSGVDFAYADNTAIYHTKNDKIELLNPGALQHLGENMLAFLTNVGSSSSLPKIVKEDEKSSHDSAIYFDILGTFMIVYRQSIANMFYKSAIVQSLLIWATSLYMGGLPAVISTGLSVLSVILMLIFSVTFSVIVAFCLPLISISPVPYIASPWLTIGLFAAPALLGALTGQHLTYLILMKHLSKSYSVGKQISQEAQANIVKLEAERWLYKAGFIQWLVLLIIGTYFEIGSSYLALLWLVPPAFAYGLLEATLTPVRMPKPLKLATLLIGLSVPVTVSAGIFVRLTATVIGTAVRFEGSPGSTPEWLGNIVTAAFIAVIVSLTVGYLLSYIHLSDVKFIVVAALLIVLGISIALVSYGIVLPFTDDTSRAINVVHVVDTTSTKYGENQDPTSYVSLFSHTPGKLTKEVDQIKEGFVCGDKLVDLVSFPVKYGCITHDDAQQGWSMSEIPTIHVEKDTKEDKRVTRVLINTKTSTRGVLGINFEKIHDFTLKVQDSSEELVPVDGKSSKDGWHTIQFSGGKSSPSKFILNLIWVNNSTDQSKGERPLLKLRTDLNRVTPKVKSILNKLPSWCSLFGKSTSPFNLAFLTSLPVDF